MEEPVLRIEGLTVFVQRGDHNREILDRLSLNIYPHEVMGLVGESGSGKTLTALAVMGLLPRTIKITDGSIWYQDQDLLKLSNREMRSIQGRKIAMIFQNPRTALNPLMRVGDQIARAIRLHGDVPPDEYYSMAVEMMKRVGIADAGSRARAYPHQLSGGMAQRVLVAMMLACQPSLLIADEPTTGLDVTIQAQIFELIKDIQAETGVSVLLITHDLGVVSEVCDRVGVMYAGQVMEIASVSDLFQDPGHPYTQRLLNSILRVDRISDLDTSKALSPISIAFDSLGCRFASQCEEICPECLLKRPELTERNSDHLVFCYKYYQDEYLHPKSSTVYENSQDAKLDPGRMVN
jgi:oligopeptide/dipeptide ABC transporter ATP-binding protein